MNQPSTLTRFAWLALAVSVCIGVSHAQGQGTGLTGKYYDAADFTSLKTTRTDATVDFNWGTAIPSGTALTSADTFSVVWSGRIEPEFSELYTFYLTVDDGARLWIDDQCLVARTFYQAQEELRGQIRLKAGHRVNIRIEYIENTGTAKAKLEWASVSQARQVVPASRLYPTTVVPNGGCVIRETWTNLPGTSIASISSAPGFPNRPASRETLTSLECLAQNWEDNYGTRITGWLRAPVSGSYQFAVSGDDTVQLHLSTDDTTANKSIIAEVTSATAFRQWDAQPSQQSSPRTLVAGHEYYFEVWHKEATGSDHFSVGWKKPGDTAYSVISGTPLVMNGTKLTRPAQASLFNTLSTEQPRILATKERFLWLKQQYEAPGSNPVKSRVQSAINTANAALAGTSVDQGIEACAIAWWVTGNNAYADDVWAGIEPICTGTGDWNYKFGPTNSYTVGIALDWFYPYWNATQRATMVNAIMTKGQNWPIYTNNIGLCHISCAMVGALAVGTANEAGAETLLNKAHAEGLGGSGYIADFTTNGGTRDEGTMYGVLAKTYLGPAMAGLESALGTTWEYGNTPGFGLPAREQYYSKSNNSDWFTFSDIGTSSKLGWGWLNWWARRFEKGESWPISRSRGSFPINTLMLTDETSPSHLVSQPPPDMYFRGPIDSTDVNFKEAVILRGNWNDPNATFVGTVGGAGSFSHGMLEDGTIQINAHGLRWFSNLSSDDYLAPGYFDGTANANSPYRWDYYRCRAEGHNTLVINPGSGPDRVVSGVPVVLNYQSSAYGDASFSVLNMTPTISGATRVNRGIRLFNNRNQVLVQDEIVMPTASTVWWFAHYSTASTTVSIAADGTSAMMTQGTERLWLKILTGGTFTDMAATPLPTSPVNPYNDPNAGYRKLAINLTNVTNSTLAVWFVPLAPGDSVPAVMPAVTALSTWTLSGSNSAPEVTNGSVNSDTLTTDVDLRSYVSDDWTYPRSMTFAVGNPQGGTVTLLADGHTARFTQPAGASGTLSFTFTATDESGLVSNSGTIQVGVTPVGHVWTSLTSGNWSDVAKWSGGSVPASNAAARIEFLSGITPGPGTITATNNLPGTTSLNSLILAGNGSSSTVNISGGVLSLVSNGITAPTIRATSPAGSAWNVGSAISLGEITSVSNDASNLAFSGIISGSGGLAIDGAGSVSFTGATANTFSGDTTLSGGSLTLAKSSGVNAIAGDLNIGDGSGTAVLLVNQSEQIANTSIVSFNSGEGLNSSTLRIAGGKTETVGGLQTLVSGQMPVIESVGLGTATLIVNSASNFDYDGVIRDGSGGAFALTKQGSGTLTLRNALGAAPMNFSGGVTISAGSLSLTSDPGATGYRRVIENWGCNISSTGTLILNNSSGTETFSRFLTGNGNLTKSGAGTVVLGNVQTYTGATNVTGGDLVIPASGGFNRATGGTLQASTGGTFQYDSPLQSRFGSIIVGSGLGSTISRIIQTSGTLTGSSLVLNNGFTSGGAGDVDLSGGLLSISGNATLSNQVAGDNIWSTVTVSGNAALTIAGSLSHTGTPSSGRNGAGRVVQSGGTVTVAGAINLARTTAGNAAPRRGEYHLDGGVLIASQITEDAGTDTFGTFNFNGGTLKPSASSTGFFQGITRTNIRDGGAFIDTNGNNITIAQDLLHSDVAGDNVIDGGVTKTGAGKLTLTGSNAYTGDTTVSSGTLSLSQVNAANEESSVVIASGATLELTHGMADTVGRLFIGSTVQPAGTYEAIGNPGTGFEIPQITGSGKFIVIASSGVATWNTTSGTWSTDRTNWDGVIGVPWNPLNGPVNDALINVTTGGAPNVTGTVYAKAITVGKSSTLSISGAGRIQSGAALLLGSGGPGTLNHDSGATSTFGAITIGNGTNNTGVLNHTGGILQATALSLGASFSSGFGSVVIGNASGNSATMNITGNVVVSAASSGATSTLTIESTGNLVIAGTLNFCTSTSRDANGKVVQNGGSVIASSLSLSGNVSDASARTHTSVYDLNGGTFTVGAITGGIVTTTGTIKSTFNFNGGTLKPTAGSATYMQGLTAAQIKTGGALIDTNGFDITIAQPLSSGTSNDGGLTKSGAGTLTLAGSNSYNGATNIVAGKLALSGSLTSNVAVNGGTLAAIGAPVTTGSVTINSGGHFEVQINGVSPGTQYGQLNVGGGVSLNGTLDISAVAGLAAGSSFTILNKTSAGAVAGAFFGKPEGSVFSASGYNWIISYAGGSGNDVVLTIATAQQSWRYANFGTTANAGGASDTADPDRDGENNFLEFATGQNPNAGTSKTATLLKNGANLEFTYVRSKVAVMDGVTFAVEWSDTLTTGSWTSAGEGALQTDNGTLQTLKATVPAGGGGKRFVRLKIMKP